MTTSLVPASVPGEPPPDGVGSQTLDRGLKVLATIVDAEESLSVAEVAARVGLHRSITYRMVRTLEHRSLITRDSAGRYRPGGGLALLARRVEPTLKEAARPHLEALAEEAQKTAFFVVPHHDQALTVLVVEPRTTVAHVSYRPGAQHPLTVGAPGLAILAGRPPRPGERREVTRARERGWAASHGEVIPGYRSYAAPVRDPAGGCAGAVAVVFVGEAGGPRLAALVGACAREVEAALA